jgi:hypothetical protein
MWNIICNIWFSFLLIFTLYLYNCLEFKFQFKLLFELCLSYSNLNSITSLENIINQQRSCRNLSHLCGWHTSIPSTQEKPRSLCVLDECAKIPRIFYAWMQCTLSCFLFLLASKPGVLQSVPLKLNFVLEVWTLSHFRSVYLTCADYIFSRTLWWSYWI